MRVVSVEGVPPFVLTASGRRLPGVTVDAEGRPVRVRVTLTTAAPPTVAAAQPEPADTGALAVVLHAIEKLANRKQPDVVVNTPPPRVVVNVPQQPAPIVNVTVEQPTPRAVRVEVGDDGVKRYVPEP